MLKILHIIQSLSLGGAAKSMISAAKYSMQLGEYKHEILSLLPADPNAILLAQEAGLRVINAPQKTILDKELFQADVIQVEFWNNPELYSFLRSELPPARLLMWFHIAGDKAPQVITKQLINYVDFALACSPYTYENPVFQNLPQHLKQQKTGMIISGADFGKFQNIQLRPHKTFNVGYIGTVTFDKMHPNFVQMSANINIPNVKFIVCGNGIGQYLKQQTEQLGIANKFDFRGYVDDVKSVIETLDVYGYPLCEDTYAASELNLQEVMFSGIPPVVFPFGGVKRLVQNNETGLIVNTEIEYKQAIEYLYQHPEERQRLGANAKKYAAKYFGAENAAKQLNELYSKLMLSPKKKRVWGYSVDMDLLYQPISIKQLGGKQLFPFEGANFFIESVGEVAPQFETSLSSQNIEELFDADELIANSSSLLHSAGSGGIMHYRNTYPNDGYLRLWTGLVLSKHQQYEQAISEFNEAIKLGCNHWRVVWYLAQSLVKMHDFTTAKQALDFVLQNQPDFIPAQQLLISLNSQTMTNHKNLLPKNDYVSPNLSVVIPDKCFPNMVIENPNISTWKYLRKEIPHNYYVDKRYPMVGFLTRDEANLLHNIALKFKGKRALEIGCRMGWSACHLALANVELDVVDPLLERPVFYQSVRDSLKEAGVLNSVNLVAGYSPQAVINLSSQFQRKWALIFIDGNHDAPAPLEDTMACELLAEPDAMIVFHDLNSPDVAQGLDYLKTKGWNTKIYQTMQIMGVAWRGNIEPVEHYPDPQVDWKLPEHLIHHTTNTLNNISIEQLITQLNNFVKENNFIEALKTAKKIIFHLEELAYTTGSLIDKKTVFPGEKWLNISEENLEQAFQGELGKKHQELIRNGFRNNLFSVEEKEYISQLNQYIAKGWKQDKIAQHFLAASLYCYPHQLPEKWFENAEVPEFLVDYFVNFMFETPAFFKELGENYQYYRYVKEWVDFLHLGVTTEPDSPLWQQMAWIFTQRANFIPLYFNSENLKEIYVKRAEIMEIALKQQGFQLDYTFAPRDKNRKKIRVGILSMHFVPQTETFATLPVFEHLDRGFEIILYTSKITNHPLEQYCESRADRLVQLPEDVQSQVAMLRQDDLDILWIVNNVTAVTHNLTLLALHRLARLQMTSFCSPTTTGMRHVDYFVAGELSSDGHQEQFSEQLVTIKGSGICFNYATEYEPPTIEATKAKFGIPENKVVLISGANFYKIIPELRETWAKILATTPNNAVLVLYPFGPAWSSSYPKEPFINTLYAALEKHGATKDQLIILEQLPTRGDVKELLKLADIYLDSYPYSGATSLLDPLAIGLPMILMNGNALRFRQGAAMLRSIGLDDLVVEDEESYIKLAVKLGTDEKLRKEYREQIVEKMANNPPFLDSKAYSAQIGEVLKQLFVKHIQ